MSSSVLSRFQVSARYLVGWTALLALIATIVVVSGEQDRCSGEWRQFRYMGVDQVARCAASGFVRAQVDYGERLFRAGRQEEAETWFEAAVAGSGSEREKSNVAFVIARDLYPEQAPAGRDNIRAAERWYQRAFNLGSDRAAVDLGLLLRRIGEPDEADHWFEQAVERSGGRAAVDIAINLRGLPNWFQPADQAAVRARWLRRGAELGDGESMGFYAEALRNGMGVERSETEAFRWYEAAAQHPQASVWDLFSLAEVHADGVGTPPDRAAAMAALNAAKGKPLDSSDTVMSGKIKSLEQRLNADGATKR